MRLTKQRLGLGSQLFQLYSWNPSRHFCIRLWYVEPLVGFRRTYFTVIQAGGLAGTAVDLLFFPLDTIKTRLQAAQGFRRAGGFSGVYKGVGSVVVGSAPGGKP